MYTPKFIRRSIWSIAIGLDDCTVYTELDGRVYHILTNDENAIIHHSDLPGMYPNLFVRVETQGLYSWQIVCDFSQMPKFNQTWQHYGDNLRQLDHNRIGQQNND